MNELIFMCCGFLVIITNNGDLFHLIVEDVNGKLVHDQQQASELTEEDARATVELLYA